jgi:3-oxoacyl-[acyl-carrier-protein] synthase II
MAMRRVVITGIGLLTPLACGVEQSWSKLLAGQSGVRPITKFRIDDLPARIAADVPPGNAKDGGFKAEEWMDLRDIRRVDDFIIFALCAAQQAVTDSGYVPQTEEEHERAGVLIGSGIGGLQGIADSAILVHEKGPRKLTPFFVPGRLINMAAGYASIRFGYKGPSIAVVTACSTGTHAIGDAARLIALDDADVMLAGGSEAPVFRLSVAGFSACRALSTSFNETPEKASRPYDKDRDGFVLGAGAGMVILEEYEHAKARGAKMYAEIKGYGLSGDAYHITAPPEDGNGAFRCMRMALKHAGMAPSDIDYVNAHGTSTQLGDEVELRAVERLFGNATGHMSMSSTKSSIGHLLGAAGAVEAIFCALAIRDQIAPATINLDHPSVETKIDLVPHTPKKRPIEATLSNSFGFGGTNATLVLTAVN